MLQHRLIQPCIYMTFKHSNTGEKHLASQMLCLQSSSRLVSNTSILQLRLKHPVGRHS